MTHDELLATINNESAWFPDFINALLAVVELHKPVNTEVGIECAAEEDGEYFHPYPCPTIQAIEKELG
jgi:hypothetical protein